MAQPERPVKLELLAIPTAIAQTMDREDVTGATLATTDGTVHLFAIQLSAGQVVKAVNFVVGGTGATTPTNQWGLLADSSSSPVILGISANGTTAAIAAGALLTYTLTTPYLVVNPGTYYVGIVTKSAAAPTLAGAVAIPASVTGAITTGTPILAGTSTTGITSTAPTSPLTAPTAQVGKAFAFCT